MDVLFLISVFRLYRGLKMSFEHNTVGKNLFLSACFCWDSGLFLRETDRKFLFGELNGYGNSYLGSVFHYSNIFRLSMQNCTTLLEQCVHIMEKVQSTVT